MDNYRKYVFSAVFLRGEIPKFLLLHRTKNWRGWELPKGGLKDDEKEIIGLEREIFEETGSRKFKVISKTRHLIKYKFPKGFVKDGHIFHGASGYLFLVELLTDKIKVDRSEHDRYVWTTKEEAIKMLTHSNQKNALEYVCKRYKLHP
ncbi:MAG: NUDIX hydrolase [Candidatus Aenigmatarchaeota archaeon]